MTPLLINLILAVFCFVCVCAMHKTSSIGFAALIGPNIMTLGPGEVLGTMIAFIILGGILRLMEDVTSDRKERY